MPRNTYLIALAAALFLASCEAPERTGKMQIVCTTGMIADMLANVAGERAEVSALMGPGVDPHLYKASQGDLAKLSQADIIFYNGLHLEGKMGELLEKVGRTKPVVAVSGGIGEERLLSLSDYGDAHDPHIWFDVRLWAEALGFAAERLIAFDPTNAEEYRARAAAYRDTLLQLDAWVRVEMAAIPAERRVLITAHDAFAYFGRAYDVEVRGLQGISTVSEYGLKDVSDLVSFISDRGIHAIFVESSVPAKALEAVVEGCLKRGHQVRIGGMLYSDAMGEEGAPEGVYTGMVRANVSTIVQNLNGSYVQQTSH
jgi:manganese/zinc/iron transport system substrate-binding protein